MPIRIPASLPAFNALKTEHVFVMADSRAEHQDIRPLSVAVLNLMPTTLDTELQLLRLLGNSPLQVNITLLRMGSHQSHHAPAGHLERFYEDAGVCCRRRFDGLIVTGAPVETLDFEAVDYWDELAEVLDCATKNVWSTLHICWGAQAGLYRRYGIPKRPLEKKLFGIFPHTIFPAPGTGPEAGAKTAAPEWYATLFRGFDDEFLAPQSRHTESDRAAVEAEPALSIQSRSDEAGIFIITARQGREIYVTGHLEYDPLTLDREYRRDRGRNLDIDIPRNYYPGDNPDQAPIVRWRAHAHLFFSNWLNYVYQETPYDLGQLEALFSHTP